MIKWIDILSPRLRAIHQDWMALRDAYIMPHLRDYNRFISSPLLASDAGKAVCIVAPVDGKPVVRSVGGKLEAVLPSCRNGMRLADACPAIHRNPLALQLPRVLQSRQAETRRGRYRAGRDVGEFEVLFLPFGDDGLRVCLVYAIYDFAAVDWKRVFA
jgi:hypothetical protein